MLLLNVVHGRNYQHLEDPDTHVVADRRQVQEDIQHMLERIGKMQSALVDILVS